MDMGVAFTLKIYVFVIVRNYFKEFIDNCTRFSVY